MFVALFSKRRVSRLGLRRTSCGRELSATLPIQKLYQIPRRLPGHGCPKWWAAPVQRGAISRARPKLRAVKGRTQDRTEEREAGSGSTGITSTYNAKFACLPKARGRSPSPSSPARSAQPATQVCENSLAMLATPRGLRLT